MSKSSPLVPLFHSTAARVDEFGNYILFPDRLIPHRQRTRVKDSPEENLVFATSDLAEAPAYALKALTSDKTIAQNASNGPYTRKGIQVSFLFDPHGNFPDHHPHGKIFQVDNSNFEQVIDHSGRPTGEWISRQEVKILESYDITPDYAMEVGTQFFTFKERDVMQKFWQEYGALNDRRGSDEEKFLLLKKFVEEGKFGHVNYERAKNPLDFDTGLLADMRYVENPQLILAGAKKDKSDEKPSANIHAVAIGALQVNEVESSKLNM